jgi:rhodanese-related sulfurtransferase
MVGIITMYRIFLLGFLFIIFFLTGCTQIDADERLEIGRSVSVRGGSYTDITVAELQTMLGEKDFTFINVHIPFEGDIPGTDLSIPYNAIEQNLSQISEGKDAKIVLYCRSDRMSRIAAATLIGLGYTNIWNLEGGTIAWERAGYQLEWE